MENLKITYLFIAGRKNRIDNSNYANDFFYGCRDFLKNSYDVDIIEMTFKQKNLNAKLLRFVDKVLRKISECSFFLASIISKKNLKIIKKTDVLIATNDRLGFSAIPYLIYLKVKNKKSIIFAMGLIKLKNKNFLTKFFNRLFTKFLIYLSSNIVFLSNNELKEAEFRFKKYSEKLTYYPFCVDVEFWSKNDKNTQNNKLLFIGNDSNRDYELVKNISKHLKDYKTVLITSQINNLEHFDNVKLIKSSWQSDKYTDFDLKNFYQDASLVFLPLKNSLQPSGQSVALQAMSMGVPVIISKTDGFWDHENLIHKKNIYVVDENSLENWLSKIEKLSNDNELLALLADEGRKIVNEKYNSKSIYSMIIELINK